MAPRMRDLTGQKFNKLTALERAGFRDGARCRKSLWKCRCDCGNEVVTASVELVSGATKSCGCIIGKHKRTHGATGTPEFMAWGAMFQRCYNPKSKSYKDYGARGIKVCDRWTGSFENFLADMGKRPSAEHSLDRYPNNDGNYEPTNCRWATDTVQSNNRRSSRTLTINGETKTYAEWERQTGLSPGMVFRRLKAGWPAEAAVSAELQQGSRRFNGGAP
jgi:hypothetical protein